MSDDHNTNDQPTMRPVRPSPRTTRMPREGLDAAASETPGDAVTPKPGTLVAPFGGLAPNRINAEILSNIEALPSDLGRIMAGMTPDAPKFTAPQLVDWRPSLTVRGLELEGFVFGHPVHRTASLRISPVWVADPAGHSMRTLSRFYRVGKTTNQGHDALAVFAALGGLVIVEAAR